MAKVKISELIHATIEYSSDIDCLIARLSQPYFL